MEKYFKGFTIQYIDRSKNAEDDKLAKATARNRPLPADVFLQIISDALIKTSEPEPRVINIIQDEDWRAPIMAYLHNYYEPDNAMVKTRMQQRAQAYQIVGNDLYKISVSGPLFATSANEKDNKYCRRSTQEYAGVTSAPELWLPKLCDRVSIGQQ
jgi:hypothetical protein